MNNFDNIPLSTGQTLGDFINGKPHKPEHYRLSYSSEGIHLSQGNKELFVVSRCHENLMTTIWFLLNKHNHDSQ